jgi:TetR/AcrR family transcriptional regulator, transcriptional repressor for nem operon
VANAVVEQLREQRESFSALPPNRAALEQIVREYLSVQHRDNPQSGCASAALLDEIGRSRDAIKRAYTEGGLVVIDDIAARLAPDDAQSARVKTLSVFALMVGTLQLSRATPGIHLSLHVMEPTAGALGHKPASGRASLNADQRRAACPPGCARQQR